MFQSSPTRERGRNIEPIARRLEQFLFQSSPTRERGRNKGATLLIVEISLFQSSPTRERGRNRLWVWCLKTTMCFNPRPRVSAGATSFLYSVVIHHHYSFVARTVHLTLLLVA